MCCEVIKKKKKDSLIEEMTRQARSLHGHMWMAMNGKKHYYVHLLEYLQDEVLMKHVRNLHANGKKDPFLCIECLRAIAPS